MRALVRRCSIRAAGFLAALACVTLAPSADAGDVTAFATFPSPGDVWKSGYGVALGSTWFQVVTFEGEYARAPGEDPEQSMVSFTGSALLTPPLGFITPYGGLGIGLFRQKDLSRSDTGVLRCFVLGVKVKVVRLIVVKGEYRSFSLSGDPLLPMDRRLSVGAGISF